MPPSPARCCTLSRTASTPSPWRSEPNAKIEVSTRRPSYGFRRENPAVTARIGIGGVWHETNTFAPGRTTLEDFAAYRLADGPEEMLDTFEGTATEIGGALAACAERGLE